MKLFGLVPSYLSWHYGTGILDLLNVWRNFLWFFYHFFSIPLLLRTLFSPLMRLREGYPRGFDPQAFASTVLVNLVMRIVGAFLRIFLIALGIVVLALVTLLGPALLLVWLTLPALIPALIVLGLQFLIPIP